MKAPSVNWGKKSKLLPSKTGLKELDKSQRTLTDYTKQVPTNPKDEPVPLLQKLRRKL